MIGTIAERDRSVYLYNWQPEIRVCNRLCPLQSAIGGGTSSTCHSRTFNFIECPQEHPQVRREPLNLLTYPKNVREIRGLCTSLSILRWKMRRAGRCSRHALCFGALHTSPLFPLLRNWRNIGIGHTIRSSVWPARLSLLAHAML